MSKRKECVSNEELVQEFFYAFRAGETYTAALSEVIDTCTRADASRIARKMQQVAAMNA